MATNVLPLLFAVGAGALILSKKKKKKKGSGDFSDFEYDEMGVPVPKNGGSGSDSETWKERQRALAFLYGIGFCKCNPGTIDGVSGKGTTNAIKAFQKAVGIKQDGIWGPEMSEMVGNVIGKIQASHLLSGLDETWMRNYRPYLDEAIIKQQAYTQKTWFDKYKDALQEAINRSRS